MSKFGTMVMGPAGAGKVRDHPRLCCLSCVSVCMPLHIDGRARNANAVIH